MPPSPVEFSLEEFKRLVYVEEKPSSISIWLKSGKYGHRKLSLETVIRCFPQHLLEVLDHIRCCCSMPLFLEECGRLNSDIPLGDPIRGAANFNLIIECDKLRGRLLAESQQTARTVKARKHPKVQEQKKKKQKQKLTQTKNTKVKETRPATPEASSAGRPRGHVPSRSPSLPWNPPAVRKVLSVEQQAAETAQLKRMMALYRESTEELQKTPSWNRLDIGYWD